MKQNHYLFHADMVSGDLAWLDESESHHARHVLRIKEGDDISVTDGRGNIFFCNLEKTSGKTSYATILKRRHYPRRPPEIEVMLGLPEKNALEDALKGLAALGIARVIPLDCEHCRKKWWVNRWEKQRDRLRRAIIAAAKQSLNPYFMDIAPPVSFEDALKDRSEGRVFYAGENGRKLSEFTGPAVGETDRITCIIGPPGGLSPTEKAALETRQALPVRLAHYRLRTELAAVVMAGCILQVSMD